MKKYNVVIFGLFFFVVISIIIWVYINSVYQSNSDKTNRTTSDLHSEVITEKSSDKKTVIKKPEVIDNPETSKFISQQIIPQPIEKEVAVVPELEQTKISPYHELIQHDPIAAYEILIQEETQNLWNRWVKLLDSNNQVSIDEKSVLAKALIYKLRNNDDEVFYQQTEELLNYSDSKKHKAMLIHLLKDIATPSALNTLLNNAQTTYDQDTKSNIVRAIYSIGENRWNMRFHTELSPLLEKSWLEVSHDQYVFKAVTMSIAKIGAPKGIQLLIDSLDSDILSPEQMTIIEYSMRSVRNRQSIHYLKANIKNDYDIENKGIIFSGTALAAMGSADSTKVLLDWAQNAPAESNKYVTTWFNMVMRDPASIALLQQKLPLLQFKNNVIKQSISNQLERL